VKDFSSFLVMCAIAYGADMICLDLVWHIHTYIATRQQRQWLVRTSVELEKTTRRNTTVGRQRIWVRVHAVHGHHADGTKIQRVVEGMVVA